MSSLFDRLLIAESGNRQTDANGLPITSNKGAIGAAQIMPTTAPEAAKLAGVPFDDRLYRTDANYNKKLGKAYLDSQLKAFGGDETKAIAAYNAGAGRVKKAIATAEKQGGNWVDYLPDETKGYIEKIKPQGQKNTQLTKAELLAGFEKQAKPTTKNIADGFGEFLKKTPPKKGIIDKTIDVATDIGKGAVGLGEAALTLGTGALAAPLAGAGAVAMDIQGILPDGKTAAQVASESAEKYIYQPRTETGKATIQALGDAAGVLQPLEAIAPMTGALAAVERGAAYGAQAAKAGAAPVIAKAAEAAVPIVQKAAAPMKSAVSSVLEKSATIGQKGKKATANAMDWIAPKAPTAPARSGSVGSAATPEELQRVARARELGFEGDTALTEGQITRNPAQQAFESDLAKLEDGEAINQRYAAQNQQIINTLDNFIDATGKQAPTKLEGGRQVVEVLGSVAENRKNQIRSAYKAAENSEEANSLIQLDDLVNHINQSAPEALNAKSLNVTRAKLLQLGAAVEDEAGNLIAQPVKLKDAERLRTAIGNAAGNDASDIRQVTIMKGIFDDATEGAGGALYKKARGLRRQFAKDFENRGVVSNLINTKRGSDDRIVAMENVLDKTMIVGSLDDVRHMRKVLQTAGEDGRQAWRELQGATLEKIKESAMTNSIDSMGNQVVSPAAFAKQVKALDSSGKLDFVFGKKGAAQLRDLSDLVQDVKVFVPGSVNMSNNRNAIMAGFMDAGVNAMLTGVPMPAITMAKAAIKAARNRETSKRVRESLKYSERF